VSRGLDHIVHAVRDLDAAAAFYRRAGFTVGARNRHAWGTHNHVVQLPGFFIEILTLAEPDKLGTDGLSQHFGSFNGAAIARGDGLSMLMLASDDIDADVADFARSGVGCSAALPFSRQATLPDGTATRIGFALGFARDTASPHAGFAACQHLNPQGFSNPAFQVHDNGARALTAVVLVADDPASHATFLSALTGVAPHITAGGIVASTRRGEVEIIGSATFADRFGVTSPAKDPGLRLAGLRIAVQDLARIDTLLRAGGVGLLHRPGVLVVPPNLAYGATLIFEG
jgi:catechol 2,3-dioxygenase-like lactoylglutathione lyase family enzyme